MYCDRCDITMSNAVPLMQAASKYMVSGLVESCETFLVAHLNSGNVCILLELGIVLSSERLEKDCLSYICKHTRSIVETNRFFKLSRLALKKVVQQDKQMLCNEDEVYDMCMHWAKRQLPESHRINPTCEEIRSVLGDAFDHIRFLSMSHVQFANLVGTSNMLTPHEKNDIYLYIATKQYSACLQFDRNVRTFLECRVVRLEVSDDLRLNPGSNGKVCAIDFMTSFSTSLTAVGLYGGTGQTDLRIQVEVSCSGNKLYKTASKRLTSDGSKTVIRVPLRRKHIGVRIMAKKVYTVQVTISGQETFCGANGVTMWPVGNLNFNQTIMFFDSSICHDLTHTNERQGQIPELYFSQQC